MPSIVLYEDELAARFTPIAVLRPVFDLRCGHFSARERLERGVRSGGGREVTWGVVVRPLLAEVCREELTGWHVNDVAACTQSDALFVNARWIGSPQSLLRDLPPASAAYIGDELAAVVVSTGTSLPNDATAFPAALAELASTLTRIEIKGALLRYPWDIVRLNSAQLIADFSSRATYMDPPRMDDRVARLGSLRDICIDPAAEIDPFVVLDARHGPIWIDANVKVQAFTRIEGPCFLGEGTQLFRANIREGCSIGPICRIGGEIEESIFHGYANKYHDGFVGHSYVCPWVNLGALTTNSDLKNDYTTVKVPLAGESIETGETKVGCYIGDHTKTALCSLFNTGSSIGVMSLILPGGELLPKHIPSFTRYWHGRIENLPGGIEASLTAARTAMGRRKRTLSTAAERLLSEAYALSETERQRAFARQART